MDAAKLRVVRLIVSRLNDKNLNWALTGSMSFALQGVPVEVHDIDIQTDLPGAYAVAECFAEYVQRPVAFRASERIQSHFGALAVGGITVEIMGGLQKRRPDGEWEEPVDPSRVRRLIVVDGMQVPVLDLEYELKAYLAMGRTEKAALLDAWLRSHRLA